MSTKPIATAAISDILKSLRMNLTAKDISKFEDWATKHIFSKEEQSAALIFDESFGAFLKESNQLRGGDFIATAGKYANKTIDHLGGRSGDLMDNVFANIKFHLIIADVLLLGLRVKFRPLWIISKHYQIKISEEL